MENNLKKEFSKRDVQRMRNIITGNAGDRTQIQTGYEKKDQVHKEGDIWQQDGKTWTIKNGIKQTVTKLDAIKKMVLMPFACPECGKAMKPTEINKKMWNIHRKCVDCVATMESAIKREGKWDEYVSGILNRNKDAELVDIEDFLEEWVTENDTFVSEQGEVEKWGGGNKKAIHEELKLRIAELRKLDIYKGQNP